MSQDLTLVNFPICPYAQRAVICSRQKKLQHIKFRDINLFNKSQYFTQTYHKAFGHQKTSNGRVPILIQGQKYLAQSDIICWYLAEKYQTGNNLIPNDFFLRAKMRWFCQTVPRRVIIMFYYFHGFTKKSKEQQQKVINKALSTLQLVQQNIKGPYVLGQQFSLADILIYPWFQRWVAIKTLFGLQFDDVKHKKIKQFIKKMKERSSIKYFILSDQTYINGYKIHYGLEKYQDDIGKKSKL